MCHSVCRIGQQHGYNRETPVSLADNCSHARLCWGDVGIAYLEVYCSAQSRSLYTLSLVPQSDQLETLT